MKLFALFLVLAISLSGGVKLLAQSDSSTTSNVSDAPLMERLEKGRQEFPITLNDKEKARIIERCEAAQQGLTNIKTNLEKVITDRASIYSTIDTKLSAVQKRFASQELDTSVADLLLARYRKDIASFNTASTNYTVALNDITTMDCKNNPELFRSQLEVVRAARKNIVDQTQAIRELIINDLKTSFDSLKTKLNTLE